MILRRARKPLTVAHCLAAHRRRAQQPTTADALEAARGATLTTLVCALKTRQAGVFGDRDALLDDDALALLIEAAEVLNFAYHRSWEQQP